MGWRFKRAVHQPESDEEGVVSENENQSENEHDNEKGEDDDYTSQQYPPPEDEKLKMLEERLAAMEVKKTPGRNFEDLGLVPGMVIPYKFKTPVFTKYDDVSCAEMHLRSYVQKIQPYTADRKLWMHFFQESLVGTQLEWYYQLESDSVRTWSELEKAFFDHYQYNTELVPTRMQLQGMAMSSKESFKEYA